nr:12219_t:CDS:2 [Entrophospora candida]
MNSNKNIGSASLPIEISDNEMIITDDQFENYYENAHDYLNIITGEDLINIKFPSITKTRIFPKIVDQFMFVINENELQIKEIIKLDFCLPPPQYINYSIKEFKKIPGFRKDANVTNDTYIRVPGFGIASFHDLNKINKIYSAIEYQQDLKILIKWIISSKIDQSIKKALNERIIKTKNYTRNLEST